MNILDYQVSGTPTHEHEVIHLDAPQPEPEMKPADELLTEPAPSLPEEPEEPKEPEEPVIEQEPAVIEQEPVVIEQEPVMEQEPAVPDTPKVYLFSPLSSPPSKMFGAFMSASQLNMAGNSNDSH